MIKIITIFAFVLSIFGIHDTKTSENCSFDYCAEKDCAIGEDYIDINERMSRVLDSNPYASGMQSYSNYRTSFFDNLTYNFGTNYKGSCGYVAIGMLLSYYDTFINDSIVPEQYDANSIGEETNMIVRRNSPGVIKDSIVNPIDPSDSSYGFDLDASNYYYSIVSLSNSSLHAKLINIGASNGFYDFDDDDNPCTTNFYIRYVVMQQYFANVLGFTYGSHYTFSYINGESNSSLSSDVRNFAIQQVLSGNPVLLSVGNSEDGHVVVAYDYDTSSDKLYCHMGWNASSTHETIEDNSFDRYKTALVINFNLSHGHTNNYGVTTVLNNIPTTNYYCYHDCRIFTYTGGNTHSYTYVQNTFGHTAICSVCGYSVAQSHVYENHYCIYCGAYTSSHDYSASYLWFNYTKHEATCCCGASHLEGHAISSSSYNSGSQYARCLLCGGLASMGFIGPLSTNDNLPRSSNGSVIMPNGVIVLAEEDCDAYFKNTLVFEDSSRCLVA